MAKSNAIFPQVIKTPRLEMRHLESTKENAQLVYDALKNEKQEDFYYNPIGIDNYVPRDVNEMLAAMQRDDRWNAENGISYYIFYNGNMIGYRRAYFFDSKPRTMQSAGVWLLRSVRGMGFAAESMNALDKMAFDILGAELITCQCDKNNTASAKTIKNAGYKFEGISKRKGIHFDNTEYDNMLWSKKKMGNEK